MINNIWTTIFLVLCTITDLKERKIYVLFSAINWIVILAINILFLKADIRSIFGGIALGLVFFAVSLLSKEAIGKGDAFVIMILSSVLGVILTLQILIWALGTCALFLMLGISLKKINRKTKVPFMPFLCLGWIITFMINATAS